MAICVGGPCHGEHVNQGQTFHTYDESLGHMVVYHKQGDLYILFGLKPSQIAELCAELGEPR